MANQPWDRLDGEPEVAHRAFLHYCEQGPQRTVECTAKELCIGDLGGWPQRYNWFARARAWDEEHGIWERRKDEPEIAYAAFAHFRDQGPKRTFGRTADAMQISHLGSWPKKFMWLARASAWDAHLDDVRRKECVAMARRHAQLSMLMQSLGSSELQKRARLSKKRTEEAKRSGEPDRPSVKVNDAVRLIDIGMRNERIARSVPAEIVEARNVDAEPVHVEPLLDYSNLSVDELRALKTMVEKAKKKA